MREIDKVLDSNEKIFWEGKPGFLPFILRYAIIALVMVLVINFINPVGAAMVLLGGKINIGAVLFSLVIFALPLLFGVWVYNNIYYAITNKRILLQKGLIGRDFTIVEFDQITNAEVNVGFVDVICGGHTGSILISTPSSFSRDKEGHMVPAPYTLANIDDPYRIFKLFKSTSHAVKSDIYYPNQYRPKNNPGYNTAFDPYKKQ